MRSAPHSLSHTSSGTSLFELSHEVPLSYPHGVEEELCGREPREERGRHKALGGRVQRVRHEVRQRAVDEPLRNTRAYTTTEKSTTSLDDNIRAEEL